MKAILYVGGALMVAASIYDFIDYKKSSHDKKFRDLYENKKEVSASVEKRELYTIKEEPAKVSEVKSESSLTSEKQELKKNSSTAKRSVGKKTRKVTFEKFSRAKLDDKVLEEAIKIEPKKQEVKTEKKEQ